MFLVLSAAIAGATLALMLRGGSPAVPNRLRALPALALGGLGLVAAEWLPIPGRPGIFIVATVLVVVALVQNRWVGGAFVAAFGLFLTGFVVLINGFLPLSSEGADAKSLTESGLRQIETADTRLPILGDVVPLPLGPWVVSFGDLIAAAGAFIFARNLLELGSGDEAVAAPAVIDLTESGVDSPQTVDVEGGLDADTFLARFHAIDDEYPEIIDLRSSARPEQPAPPPPTDADRL